MIAVFSGGEDSLIGCVPSLLLLLPEVGPMLVVTKLFGVSGS